MRRNTRRTAIAPYELSIYRARVGRNRLLAVLRRVRNHPYAAQYAENRYCALRAERLHDRVNGLVGQMLCESRLRRLQETGAINVRQYTIVAHLMASDRPLSAAELRRTPWYQSLYLKLTDKTRQRDLHGLLQLNLLRLDRDECLQPVC